MRNGQKYSSPALLFNKIKSSSKFCREITVATEHASSVHHRVPRLKAIGKEMASYVLWIPRGKAERLCLVREKV